MGFGLGSFIGGVGGMLGGHKEAQGYGRAQAEMEALKKEASTTQGMIDPYSKYRSGAAETLNDYLTGKKSIQTDPGYQFTMNEGMNQVNRAGAAKGYGRSGNIMAALQQRGSDIASQQYSSIMDRLTNLAGAGSQNAIAGGQAYGNIMTTASTGVADAQIGKGFANSRAISSLYGGVGNTVSSIGSFFGAN